MAAIPLAYNWRNIMVRRVTTLMTSAGIALTVGTFVALMAMAQGLGQTLVSTASTDNAVVIRKGSMVEVASSVTFDQLAPIEVLPHLARDAAGRPLVSPEVVLQVMLEKRGGGVSNVTLRGVRPAAAAVHDRFRIVAGRMPASGRPEVIVGVAIVRRFVGMEPGRSQRWGRQDWPIVGVFSAGGGAFESEVWTDAESLMADTQRRYFSALTVKLSRIERFAEFERLLADDPRINLQAKLETDYYEELTQTASLLRGLGMLIAIIMSIGAVFAAMNTMYAAILTRIKEIGTLRALGFSRAAILTSFVVESLLVALPGGILGCLLALPVHGITSGTLNMQNFSDLAFEFTVSAPILAGAAGFTLAIGLLGGVLPARHAASIPITQALREA